MKVLCLSIQLVPSLKVSDELLLRYKYFCRDIPILKKRSMRCHRNHAISHGSNGFISLGQFFSILMVSQNNFTHIRSFPDRARLVSLDPRVLRNAHAVTCFHISGHGHCDILI